MSFLLANGYSDNAAAGIAGNMYQESEGNPESEGMGGGGLIGFTPLPGGYVTGDPAADLQTQLSAVLAYNQQWASYLPALNAAATPADCGGHLRHRLRAGGHPRRQQPRGLRRGSRRSLRHLGPAPRPVLPPPEGTGRPARASPSPGLPGRRAPPAGRPLSRPDPEAVWPAESCVVVVDLREYDVFMISEAIKIDVSL